MISWDSTLKNSLRLKSEHISAYALTLNSSSSIARRIAKQELPPVDDDLQAEMFTYATEILNSSGYIHYEISNFARPGYQCHHNVGYWRNGNYLGLGAGAHSHFDNLRYFNVNDPKIYIERIKSKGSAKAGEEKLTTKDVLAETIFLGLRLMEGINLEDLSEQFDLPLDDLYASTIEDLKSKGLLVGKERLKLIAKGVLLSNEVFSQFV